MDRLCEAKPTIPFLSFLGVSFGALSSFNLAVHIFQARKWVGHAGSTAACVAPQPFSCLVFPLFLCTALLAQSPCVPAMHSLSFELDALRSKSLLLQIQSFPDLPSLFCEFVA
jgi:hypothetical protein